MFSFLSKGQMPTADTALPGRAEAMVVNNYHHVLGTSLLAPYPEECEKIILGLGCFWGAEKCFWSLPGVFTTAVGYSAGFTKNPTYEEVCSGQTGHNEVVLVVYRPDELSLEALLNTFWQAHNPTQGMRQGNDKGTQYRSGVYFFNDDQQLLAKTTQAQYQQAINEQMGSAASEITTEIIPAADFYFAEDYHQQYLAKNPNGYCGLGGLGISM